VSVELEQPSATKVAEIRRKEGRMVIDGPWKMLAMVDGRRPSAEYEASPIRICVTANVEILRVNAEINALNRVAASGQANHNVGNPEAFGG
jgi:hypothetical protein